MSATRYIGLMSGTSMDAIDTALVHMDGNELDIIDYREYPVPEDTKQALRAINKGSPVHEVVQIDRIMAGLFADAVLQIIKQNDLSSEDIRAIGSHGQTVLHAPGGQTPGTLQIGDPNLIAYRTGITTIADFRRMDIAAGGQGAPLAPIFHQWYFCKQQINRIVLNLGGIANITIISSDDKDEVIGFDTGPGNGLMDAWSRRHLHQDFDKNGQWASSGACHQGLLSLLLDEKYFKLPPPKSTGKDYFNEQWLNNKLSRLDDKISNEDVQATLLELSAVTISKAIQSCAPNCRELLICGGGVHNTALIRCLNKLNPDTRIANIEKYGLDPDSVEAVTLAWLAKRRLENRAGNLCSVTGARQPVLLGGIYDGRRPATTGLA